MKKNSQLVCAGIIPARYASSRLPGKPLALIGNKTMIQRVYEQARKSLDIVYVATDDERIYNEVLRSGGKAVMTSSGHRSGTDRCAEAAGLITGATGMDIDVVINIQGDEPFIQPRQIDLIRDCFNDGKVRIATLVRKSATEEEIFNPGEAKVIINKDGDAIYFSRAVIPFVRGAEKSEWIKRHVYYTHVGLYGYRISTLKKITRLAPSPLEISESLEQNRWIENGLRIRTVVTTLESMCIETPEDLEKARRFLEHLI
jgi:3-deoxy-manno-octulosonate cytidylyltransferase (CMP-KDO synthetase)